MSKESFPFQESHYEEKEAKRGKWDKIRTFLLAGSLLANGGFLAERGRQHLRLEGIENGQPQSFEIDQPNRKMGDNDPGSGRRARFELARSPEGAWTLVGKVESYVNGPEGAAHNGEEYTLRYEFPPLPPKAIQDIFDQVHDAEEVELHAEEDVFSSPDTDQARKHMATGEEYLARLIKSARRATLVESRGPNTTYKVEIDLEGTQTATVTTTHKSRNGEEVTTQKLPLGELTR